MERIDDALHARGHQHGQQDHQREDPADHEREPRLQATDGTARHDHDRRDDRRGRERRVREGGEAVGEARERQAVRARLRLDDRDAARRREAADDEERHPEHVVADVRDRMRHEGERHQRHGERRRRRHPTAHRGVDGHRGDGLDEEVDEANEQDDARRAAGQLHEEPDERQQQDARRLRGADLVDEGAITEREAVGERDRERLVGEVGGEAKPVHESSEREHAAQDDHDRGETRRAPHGGARYRTTGSGSSGCSACAGSSPRRRNARYGNTPVRHGARMPMR